MTKEMIMTQLFEFSAPTYYKWKKQDKRKIINLIEYAFTDEELVEFLNTGRIARIEDMGNQDYLLDLSLKFYKLLRHMTNYKVAKKVLTLLEKSFEENSNKVLIEKIAEDIYNEDEFYTSMKLAILNLIQRQDPLVLEYICKNRVKLESDFTKKASKSLKKTDFLVPNMA